MKLPRTAVIGASVFIVLWIVALSVVAVLPTDQPPPDSVTVAPVRTYSADDLARAADALEALSRTRLTPAERVVVEDTADIVTDLATGTATVEPVTPPTTVPPSTTTTVAPVTTTTTPTVAVPDVSPDDLTDDYTPTTVP